MKYTFDIEAAEDIVQDSFVKAWKNLSKFDDGNSFKTWLYTIGKNTTLDYLKKNKNLPFSALQGIEDMVLEPALINSPGMSAAQHINAHYIDMKDGLNILPDKDRNIIEMHYQQGYAFREIAEKLGRSTDTVKTWHRRAIKRLRDMLE
jgi:RNA polymerase sigma-70 factor (ECF subfamily)